MNIIKLMKRLLINDNCYHISNRLRIDVVRGLLNIEIMYCNNDVKIFFYKNDFAYFNSSKHIVRIQQQYDKFILIIMNRLLK